MTVCTRLKRILVTSSIHLLTSQLKWNLTHLLNGGITSCFSLVQFRKWKQCVRISFKNCCTSFIQLKCSVLFKVKENSWQSSKLFQESYYNVSKRKKKRNKTRCFLFTWTWGHNYFTTNNAYWQENKWHENREPTANTWNISWENPHFSLNTCQWK